jgi:anaerobic magnesium-protoporphyrin IX monomethyl ester cyclase
MTKVLLADVPYKKVAIPKYYAMLHNRRLRTEELMLLGRTNRRRVFLYASRGLLTIGSALKQEGFDVQYINIPAEDNLEKLFHKAKESDLVCFTALTPTIDLIGRLSYEIKQINPQLLIAVGGHHVTSLDVETLREKTAIDIVVRGEGEATSIDLVKKLSKLAEVRGITYRCKGKIKRNPPKPLLRSDEIPIPMYDLLENSGYSLRHFSFGIQTQRGCPYKCHYCSEGLFWKELRFIPLKKVVDEILFLNSKLPSGDLVYFNDSIFLLRPKRAQFICRIIREQDVDLTFTCDTRSEFVNEDIARKLSDANFTFINIGVEDGNDFIKEHVGRICSFEESKSAAKKIKKYNMIARVYWMTGIPGSTHNTMRANIIAINKLLRENAVDMLANKLFIPYPGTPIFNHPDKYGVKILSRDWKRYDRLSFPPVYRLLELTEYEIYAYLVLMEEITLANYLRKLALDVDKIDEICTTERAYGFKAYQGESNDTKLESILRSLHLNLFPLIQD